MFANEKRSVTEWAKMRYLARYLTLFYLFGVL